MDGTGVVLTAEDPWLDRRLARLESEFGLRRSASTTAGAPALVVVDLGAEDSAKLVRELRARWPEALLAGYLTVPDHQRWLAGQRAGCDVVANRGALVGRLRPLLAGGPKRGRRFPLLAEADLGGRLGLVARIDETPVGPVALFQVDGQVCAVADRCPHAGATLSTGELDGTVITCPRHGSQFDVRTGERTRGPADVDIAAYPVLVIDGQVVITIDPGEASTR
jgi:nitrite reductase/ring-hydroxylating ferredoxin subunit